MTGVFNLRIAGIEESMKNILIKLMSICNGALHLNVLSYNTVQRDVELFYAQLADLLEFAQTGLAPDAVRI